MNSLLFILILCGATLFVGAALLGLILWYKKNNNQPHPWQTFAAQAGLTYSLDQVGNSLVSGTYRGRSVRLETVLHFNPLGADTTMTHLTLTLNNPRQAHLTILTGAIAGKIGSLFGAGEIKTGDPDLDRKFTFRSDPPELGPRVLLHPQLRQLLLSAPDLNLSLEKDQLLNIQMGEVKDFPTLFVLLDLLVILAWVFENTP
jgi:hypothetical protein